MRNIPQPYVLDKDLLLPHPALSPQFRPPLIGNHTTVNHLPTFWYPPVIAVLSFSDCRYVLPFTSGGRSRRRGASMPGHEQCPMQTGRDIGARGDQCGRGTRTEYDRRGKYSLYLGNELLPKMPYSASGRRDGDTQDNNALGRIYRTILNEQNFLLLRLSLATSQGGTHISASHRIITILPTKLYTDISCDNVL